MDRDEITRTVNSFPMWGMYQFDLKGVLTPIADKATPHRTLERKNYFFDPLVHLLGGSLKGKRVLDIACNAGFWSLKAIESGCDFVMGIDGRQMHIDQANFVFKVNEIDENRYRFVTGNVFDLDFREFQTTFDIVFCFGFFHHVSKHMQLLEKISQVNSDLLVLETRVSRIPGEYMAFIYGSTDWHVNALDYPLTMVPTKQAVPAMVQQFGYRVVTLRPQARHRSALPDYKLGRRRAFVCSKKTDLSKLPAQLETINLRTKLFDVAALGTHWLGNRILGSRKGNGKA